MALSEHDYPLYMQRCLQLARLGEYYVAPNPMVGAVLVDANGAIISEGWHEQYGGPHAEVNCLKSLPSLCWSSRTGKLERATLFVSLEPCSHYGKTPPCADLIISKGIKRVVVGCLDPNPRVAGNGVRKLQDAGVEVITGVLEQECRELNKRFICLQEKRRPYVILKWAQTADGVIGIAPSKVDFIEMQHKVSISDTTQLPPVGGDKREAVGAILVISNPLTKQIVHKMRAENMAILVGTNTALLDNPKLLNTHWSGRNPIRVLLDRHQRVPATARIFSPEAETIVYTDNTDWAFVLSDLASRNIHSVLVEGGAKVLQHILDSNLYDEIHVEVSCKTSESLLSQLVAAETGGVVEDNGEVSPQVLGAAPEGVQYIYAPKISLPATPDQIIEGNSLYVISKENDAHSSIQ